MSNKLKNLYEFESIEHGIVCAISVNPKEYLEVYGILFDINKKHKGFELRKVFWVKTHDRRGKGRYQQILEKTKTDEIRKQKEEDDHGHDGKG